MGMAKGILKRSEISEEYKWALEDIFASDEEFLKACDDVEELSLEASKFEGRLESAKQLKTTFLLMENINRIVEKVVMYANMRFHEDTSVSKYQGFVSKAQNINSIVAARLSFIEPEILEMNEEKVYGFINENADLKSIRCL